MSGLGIKSWSQKKLLGVQKLKNGGDAGLYSVLGLRRLPGHIPNSCLGLRSGAQLVQWLGSYSATGQEAFLVCG